MTNPETNPSLRNRIIMVTGATDGIGWATTQALARMGASLVLVARNRDKCRRRTQELLAANPKADIEWLTADLSSLFAIRGLALEFQQRYPRLDVLINNVGGIFLKRQLSVDGLEMTFALNHLGPFLLTHLMMDSLRRSVSARIVNVSSNAHFYAHPQWDDLQGQQRYRPWAAYTQSKLFNLLFTYEASRRRGGGSTITINALHPGFVSTRIGLDNGALAHVIKPAFNVFAAPAEVGAKTSVYLASAPELGQTSGQYFIRSRIAASSLLSHDIAAANRLWQISEDLTGLSLAAT